MIVGKTKDEIMMKTALLHMHRTLYLKMHVNLIAVCRVKVRKKKGEHARLNMSREFTMT